MTDTSKREELIEEAAKAMCDRAGEEEWEDCPQDWYRADARAAFAVFEQAHTPTDDERATVLSILADMDYNDGGMMRWSSGRPTEQAEKVADRIVRELRRTAVQEPSDEPTDAQVLAALNTWYAKEREQNGWPIGSNAAELADYSPQTQDRMRAALRAAYEEGKKR